MEAYNRSSHAVYRCEYHFVWVPKYRYHVLVKEVKPRLKEILVELCNWLDITIIEGAICSDHVHMYLSVPPKLAPSHVMKILKGKSAERLREEFPVEKTPVSDHFGFFAQQSCQFLRLPGDVQPSIYYLSGLALRRRFHGDNPDFCVVMAKVGGIEPEIGEFLHIHRLFSGLHNA